MSESTQTKPALQLPIADQPSQLVDLTEAAANEVRRLIESQDLHDQYLRVGVQGGGCAGLSYQLNFDATVGQFDKVFDIRGVKVVVDLKSALYLKGVTIDYVPAMVGGGFKFINPSASKSCGCGTSFSA